MLAATRVVLDTNIILSACWTPSGLEAHIVARSINRHLEAYVSEAVWAEYEDVLFRKKFASIRVYARVTLDRLREAVRSVTPTESVDASFDEDDNRFLECASAAQAEYLITGNLKHYPKEYGAIRIRNARQFLAEKP